MATIFEHQSPYQHISLDYDEGGLLLFLDGYYQFDSRHEHTYHEFIGLLPLALSENTNRVLIMGGGDGLALREVLKYPLAQAVLIELDQAVLDLAKVEPLARLNRRSLSDPRAKVIAGDAKEWVKRLPPGSFDVIVADFPAATSPELEQLYSAAFYEEVFRLLAPGGIFVTQVSEEPSFRETLRQYMEAVLGHSFTLVGVPSVAFTESFIFGSRKPIRVRRPAPEGVLVPRLLNRFDALLRAGKRIITYVPKKRYANMAARMT